MVIVMGRDVILTVGAAGGASTVTASFPAPKSLALPLPPELDPRNAWPATSLFSTI
jgi:hypothetical protein